MMEWIEGVVGNKLRIQRPEMPPQPAQQINSATKLEDMRKSLSEEVIGTGQQTDPEMLTTNDARFLEK